MPFSGHTSQPAIYITSITFTVLACVAVLLRLVTRFMIVRKSGWDDVFISIAAIMTVLMAVAIVKQAEYGMGQHIYLLGKGSLKTASQWFWAFFWIYYTALGFTKLSVLLQYIPVFVQPAFRKACFVLIGVVSIWSIWAVLSSIFICTPISTFWNNSDWHAKGCFPRLTLWYVNAAVNIATDCATALLPLPVIHSLAIPRRQKTILMFVFAAGLCTCLISILRLVYIYPIATSPDLTWQTPLPVIWSCVETNVAIICSCAPTLKGLVQRFFPDLLGPTWSSQDGSGETTRSSWTRDSLKKRSHQMSVLSGKSLEVNTIVDQISEPISDEERLLRLYENRYLQGVQKAHVPTAPISQAEWQSFYVDDR